MSSTQPASADPATGPLGTPPVDRPVGHTGARVNVTERRAFAVDGFLALLVGIGVIGLILWRIVSLAASGTRQPAPTDLALIVVGIIAAMLIFSAIVVIQPGETSVVQFFGRYVGTARRTGLTMLMPLTTKKKVSIRVNNFETNVLKVNDADGNPVEIAAIIVWQVADTAKASFAVEAYKDFVKVQSEAALRHVANG